MRKEGDFRFLGGSKLCNNTRVQLVEKETDRTRWAAKLVNDRHYVLDLNASRSCSRDILSAPSCKRNYVDLWTQDDGSGRQQWYVSRAPVTEQDVNEHHGEIFYLKITKGREKCDRNWLSVPNKGPLVDLWSGSGPNQKWLIKGFSTRLMYDNASSN